MDEFDINDDNNRIALHGQNLNSLQCIFIESDERRFEPSRNNDPDNRDPESSSSSDSNNSITTEFERNSDYSPDNSVITYASDLPKRDSNENAMKDAIDLGVLQYVANQIIWDDDKGRAILEILMTENIICEYNCTLNDEQKKEALTNIAGHLSGMSLDEINNEYNKNVINIESFTDAQLRKQEAIKLGVAKYVADRIDWSTNKGEKILEVLDREDNYSKASSDLKPEGRRKALTKLAEHLSKIGIREIQEEFTSDFTALSNFSGLASEVERNRDDSIIAI